MDTQCVQETVINISSKELTNDQKSLLQKGLSFVPKSNLNVFGLKVDLFKCFRQIKLRHFFSKMDTRPNITPFRPKSSFCPMSLNPSINTFCRIVENDIMQISTANPHVTSPNLTKEEKIALTELMNDKTIVIKSSDKGGGICIQDSDKYRQEILSQLSDPRVYRKLTSDPTVTFQKKLSLYLQEAKLKNWLSESDCDFLYCKFPICPVFYTLPKIHKSLTNPPGHPIVAQTDSLWSPLSTFVDYYIKPYVQTLPTYIKDSSDFIEKCTTISNLPEETFLLTLDITSLYTNIPHDGGLEALAFYLQDRSHISHHPNQLIIDLAEFVMKFNFFTFERDFYLQVSGTSMGTVCAPNYANLYVGLFENKFVFNSNHNKYHSNIIKWFRYIDDIFCIFNGSMEELNDFVSLLNTFDSNLNFTAHFSPEKVCFLDMWVKKEHGSILTSLYRKETDKNTLLLASSFHPTPLKRGLPISQFLRLRRICHSTEDFINQSREMKIRFQQRGYPNKWIDDAYEHALKKTRTDVLQKTTKTQKNFSVTCMTQYSAHSSAIKSVFLKHWHILKSDPELSSTFKYPPLFVNKRGKNLRDFLVRADFTPEPTPSQTLLCPLPNGNYRCGNCAQCNNTVKIDHFVHPHTGKKYPIKSVITCASTHVIYILRCPCGLVYVGKTTRKLKQRISEHKSSIRRNDRDYPVAIHFNDNHHDVCSLRFYGIEYVPPPPRGGDHDRLLKQREAFWIHTLQTLAPKGLNDEFNLNIFL